MTVVYGRAYVYVVSYVETIEPRLTPTLDYTVDSPAVLLSELCRDLAAEVDTRLELMSDDDVHWRPHPDSNDVGVTIWHIARWLDVLGSQVLGGGDATADIWHARGWSEWTGYDPIGVGFLGLGTLTGYTADEMRAVPRMGCKHLRAYLAETTQSLNEEVLTAGASVVVPRAGRLTPFQQIITTLQGSFGHVGEIDTLVALRSRVGASSASGISSADTTNQGTGNEPSR